MTDVIRHFHHRRILPSMLLIAITTITAFVPFTAPVSADALCGSTRVALRTRKPTALAELPFALSPEVFGTAPVDYAALPPDMKEFAPEPHAKFSHTFMCATGAYILLNAALQFLPLIGRKATSKESDLVANFLASVSTQPSTSPPVAGRLT